VGHWEYLNATLDDIADCCVYEQWAQDLFSFAGYWRGASPSIFVLLLRSPRRVVHSSFFAHLW
jgi:hypothetical protein